MCIFLPTFQFFPSTHTTNLWSGLVYLAAIEDLKGLVPVGRNTGWVPQCHFSYVLFISSPSRTHISNSFHRGCLLSLRSFLTFTRCRAVLHTWGEGSLVVWLLSGFGTSRTPHIHRYTHPTTPPHPLPRATWTSRTIFWSMELGN